MPQNPVDVGSQPHLRHQFGTLIKISCTVNKYTGDGWAGTTCVDYHNSCQNDMVDALNPLLNPSERKPVMKILPICLELPNLYHPP
jgi:hypothetical protein